MVWGKMVTHIYFDWSKTLARPKTRDIFINSKNSMKDRLAVLYPDTLPTLEYLFNKGYTLGIISNTHKRPADFVRALSETGLIRYFKGTIALSSDPALCKKACAKIFNHCLKNDGLLARPDQAVMVGDDYARDVVGGLRVGMHAVHVDRTRRSSQRLTVTTLGELVQYF